MAALPDALAAGVLLPHGRLVHGEEGEGAQPAMWVSDGPATGRVWTALRAAHENCGRPTCPTPAGGTRKP